MPVVCNASTLTGSSGAVYFIPAGTKACLLADDFAAGGVITVSSNNDFRVGDLVEFSEIDGATLDSGITAATPYRVTVVDGTANTVTVVLASDGSAVTLSDDGDTTTGHIEMQYEPAQGICECREWSVDYSREQLDVTTLPCGVGASAGGAKYAATKRFQPGFAEITGTLTVYITDDSNALGNRLMESIHLNNQDGAFVKLYLDAVSDGQPDPQPSDLESKLIAGPVTFTDFSTSVNPDDPTNAEISFQMFDPTNWIGLQLK